METIVVKAAIYYKCNLVLLNTNAFNTMGCRRDRMVVGFSTTYAISAYHY